MDDADKEKEQEKKDERPAARPSRPVPRQVSNLENYYEVQAEKQEKNRLNNTGFANGKGPIVLVILGGVVVVSTFVLMLFGPGGSGGMGKFDCEQEVKRQLRSPSTASVVFSTNAQSSDNPSNWRHTGTVTAQNGFGAMITSSWGCIFEDGIASVTIG
jgi:hypothetical protein